MIIKKRIGCFGDMNRGPSIVMGEHEGDSTDPGPGPDKGRMVPDGYAYMWNVYAYDSSVDSLVVMAVDAEGVFDGYMLGTDEVDEEVDFSKMKPLPESYIDSDSAMVIASEMGGDRFLDYYSSKEGREYSEWGVDLYAIHEYWALSDENPEDVPVMWVATYFGVSKDMEGWTEMAEYSIYMDIATGDTLLTEWYYPEEEPYEPQGIVFSEAVEMAQAMLDSMDIDAAILGGETFYGMGNGDGEGKEEDDYKEEDRLFFGDMNRGPSIVMGEHEGDSTDPGPGPDKGRMVPDGYAYMWNVYAYDSSVDSLVVMAVDAEGVFDGYMLGTDEVDEEVDFSKMKPLPESYIDSDSAMVIASEMGGDRFLDYYSSKEGREYSEWGVDLYAIHEYWALSDENPEDVPVMWVATYFGVSKDMEGWTEMAEYSIYMDIATGDTLLTEWYYPEEEPYEPQGIVFSEAVEMAQAMLDSMDIDAAILGGETFYGMGNGDGEGKEEDDYKEEDRLFFGDMNRGPSIVMGEHEGDSTDPGPGPDKGRMVPDGYAYMWNVYAYDSSVDSLVVMAVDAEGVFDGYMLGTDEVDEEVDFSKMKPLPESYIDSDSAMVIASEMGGDRFLDYYSSKEGREYSEWGVDLYAIHEYWALSDENPEDVPVMWVATYFGVSKDMEGWTEMAEYSIYMDIATGDTEEEPYEPQGIVFRIEMAQAMDSMDIDAAILGGETFYGKWRRRG